MRAVGERIFGPPTSRWPCPHPQKLRKSAAPTQILVSPSAQIPSPFPPSVSSHDRGQTYSAEWSDDEGSNSFNASEANGGTNPFDEDSAGKGVRVRALYDYDGQEQDELSFKAGEDPQGAGLSRGASARAAGLPVVFFGVKRPELCRGCPGSSKRGGRREGKARPRVGLKGRWDRAHEVSRGTFPPCKPAQDQSQNPQQPHPGEKFGEGETPTPATSSHLSASRSRR